MRTILQKRAWVYLIGDPSVKGIVMSITDLGDNTKKYDVFVDGSFKTYYSGQIAPVVEKVKYNWVDINTLRSYLTAYQINNSSGRFVFTEFLPELILFHISVQTSIEAGFMQMSLREF